MDELLVDVAQSPRSPQSAGPCRVRARVVSTTSFLAAFCAQYVAVQHAFSVAQQRVRAPRVRARGRDARERTLFALFAETVGVPVGSVARAARGTESGPGADVGHINSGSRALYGL